MILYYPRAVVLLGIMRETRYPYGDGSQRLIQSMPNPVSNHISDFEEIILFMHMVKGRHKEADL